MLYVYCGACREGKEQQVAEYVHEVTGCETLVPMDAQQFRCKGTFSKRYRALFPGYFYAFSEQPIGERLAELHITGVDRWLGSRDSGYTVPEDEREFALFFRENDGIIDFQTGYEVDGRIYLLPCGKRRKVIGEVRKVDRGARRLMAIFRFGEKEVCIWTGFRLVPAPSAASA